MAGIALAGGCLGLVNDSEGEETDATGGQEPEQSSEVEMHEIGMDLMAGGYKKSEIRFIDASFLNVSDIGVDVSGTIKNVSDTHFDEVSMDVTFTYGESGDSTLCSDSGYVENVPPGAEVEFRLPYRCEMAVTDSAVAWITDVDTIEDT